MSVLERLASVLDQRDQVPNRCPTSACKHC